MQVFCQRCERQHDFQPGDLGGVFYCECGAELKPGPRARMRLLGRRADEVCRMILTSACPAAEIAIERGRLREIARALAPDRMDVYEMIYESRFDRLWAQFRSDDEGGREDLDP